MDRYMIVIPAKNRALVWKCDDGEGMKLETLQMLVGGSLEPVATNLEPEWAREKDVNSIVLLVDKEGRMMGRLVNPRATEMADGNFTHFGNQPLVGPAIVAATRGEEMIGFSKHVADTLLSEWG